MKTFGPVHPGELLSEDFLMPLELSANALAMKIHVPATRVGAILKGERGITLDTALRLSRFFGTGPEIWLSLQTRYDLDSAKNTLRKQIEREIQPLRETTGV